MDQLVERVAGLDVHKSSVTACVRVPGDDGERDSHVQTFATTTKQLLALRDWLGSFEVTLVSMEATGVYWKPVYYLLEDDFECWLLNAQHLHNVPGRKTDVADAAWIAELTEHGLVRPSFVPPKPIRELRNLTRYRRVVIEDRAREVQRLHKVLEGQLPRCPVLAAPPPKRAQQGRGRRRPLHPRHRVAHPQHRRALPRSRPRLLPRTTAQRGLPASSRRPARAHRLRRRARAPGRGLTGGDLHLRAAARRRPSPGRGSWPPAGGRSW